MLNDQRLKLLRKLKEENCFWSYDISKMDDISDEALIEHVMLYLDIDDINQLFPLFGYKKVKLLRAKCSDLIISFMPGITLVPSVPRLM